MRTYKYLLIICLISCRTSKKGSLGLKTFACSLSLSAAILQLIGDSPVVDGRLPPQDICDYGASNRSSKAESFLHAIGQW